VRLRSLPLGDVAQGEIGRDARGAPTAKEAVEVREPTLQFAQVLPPTGRLVVRAEIGRDLVVKDAVDPGRDRRPRGGGALAQLETRTGDARSTTCCRLGACPARPPGAGPRADTE